MSGPNFSQSYKALADPLAEMGYDRCIPLKRKSKAPRYGGWEAANTAPVTPAQRLKWVGRGAVDGVGMAAGGLACALDFDQLEESHAAAVRGLADEIVGPSPVVRVGQWPKTLRLYRQDEDDPVSSHTYRDFDLGTYGSTGQVALFAVHPVTEEPYYYPEATPLDIPACQLPILSNTDVQHLITEMRRMMPDDIVTDYRQSGGGRDGVMADAREHWDAVRDSGVPLSRAMHDFMASLRGQFHPAMTGAVALLASAGYDEQEIIDAIAEPYLKHFASDHREVLSRYRKLLNAIRGAYRKEIGVVADESVFLSMNFGRWAGAETL